MARYISLLSLLLLLSTSIAQSDGRVNNQEVQKESEEVEGGPFEYAYKYSNEAKDEAQSAKGSTGSTEDGALGAEESLRVSRAVNSFSNIKLIEHAAVLLVLAWSTLVAWHGSRLGGRSDIGFCSCAFVLHDGCPFLKSIDRSVDLYYQDRDGARYFDF